MIVSLGIWLIFLNCIVNWVVSVDYYIDCYVGGVSSTSAGFSGDGGPSSAAALDTPYNLATDSLGVVYISDSGNNRIRKVDSNSIITTFGGGVSSTYNGDGGPVSSGQFSISGIWIDTLGNIYFADSSNNRFRMVDTNFIMNTVVGGNSGTTVFGVPVTSAKFSSNLKWVAGDTLGNMYFSMYNKMGYVTAGSSTFKWFASSGGASDVGGNGAATSMNMNVASVCVDASGIVYVTSDNFVRSISSGYSTKIGGTTTGQTIGIAATSTNFGFSSSVLGLRVDDTNLYLAASQSRHRIWTFPKPTGIASSIAGSNIAATSGNGGSATQASLNYPCDIHVTTTGLMYITSSGDNSVRILFTAFPTMTPTMTPSILPTYIPTVQPTIPPSLLPSNYPTIRPSAMPSLNPSIIPSMIPSLFPSLNPTVTPSICPSVLPTTLLPSLIPSDQPSIPPTATPSYYPTSKPSSQPSRRPTTHPSSSPSKQPSVQPSSQPTNQPTKQPTSQPTSQPTKRPSGFPSCVPSGQPSFGPTRQPSLQPIRQPTSQPSRQPSSRPSCQPFCQPSTQPSAQPTSRPTSQPSRTPSCQSTSTPTVQPSVRPSMHPSSNPSRQPSRTPSSQPSTQPSGQPSGLPSSLPSGQPSRQPTVRPTRQPSAYPSCRPSVHPFFRSMHNATQIPTIDQMVVPTEQSSITNATVSILGNATISFRIIVPLALSLERNKNTSVLSDIVLRSGNFGRAFRVSKDSIKSSTITLGSSLYSYPSVYALDVVFRTVSVLNDVNGDGCKDIIVGDPLNAKCYVLFGTSDGFEDMKIGFTIFGESSSDLTCWSVSGAGDVNNDTIDDIVIGATVAHGVGAAYVIYGGHNPTSDIYLNSLTSTQGFAVYGSTKSDYLGISVSNAGDVNNDGYDDIIVGAAEATSYYAGSAIILYGGSSLNTFSVDQITNSRGYILSGGSSYMYVGYSVSAAGDLNSDGYADVLIGSNPQRSSLVLSTYLVYGSQTMTNAKLTSLFSQGCTIVGGGSIVSYDGHGSAFVGADIPYQVDVGMIVYYNFSELVAESNVPTVVPVISMPSFGPSLKQSRRPTMKPSLKPSVPPTTIAPTFFHATLVPTNVDQTVIPTVCPSVEPSEPPTCPPTMEPSDMLTGIPTCQPSPIAPNILSRNPVILLPIRTIPSRAPFRVPTVYPTFPATNLPIKDQYIDGSKVFCNYSNWVQSTRYIVNGTGLIVIVPSQGQITYRLVPGRNLILTITQFNESADLIDLSLFSSIRKYSDLVITHGSAVIELPTSQIIHILDQEPDNLSEDNFLLTNTQPNNNAYPLVRIIKILLYVVFGLSLTLCTMGYRCDVGVRNHSSPSFMDQGKIIVHFKTNADGEYVYDSDVESVFSEDLSDHTLNSNGAWVHRPGHEHSVSNNWSDNTLNSDDAWLHTPDNALQSVANELSDNTLDSEGAWITKEEGLDNGSGKGCEIVCVGVNESNKPQTFGLEWWYPEDQHSSIDAYNLHNTDLYGANQFDQPICYQENRYYDIDQYQSYLQEE